MTMTRTMSDDDDDDDDARDCDGYDGEYGEICVLFVFDYYLPLIW